MNLKIAYLMHIDWDWIKQRPHFIYEELSKYFEVDLFFVHKFYDRQKKTNIRNVHSKSSKVNRIRKMPFSGRFKSMQWIERTINSRIIHSFNDYDIIWITSPLILDFIPLEQFHNKTVIYDCMDDFFGFYNSPKRRVKMQSIETALIQRADVIITSSAYLKHKLISFYQGSVKAVPIVINNGISLAMIQADKYLTKGESLVCVTNFLNLMYIGTIGEWIDFELILSVLDQIHDVMFIMIGPVITKVPKHPRINYIGIVEHDKIDKYALNANAFIMPFKLNELVRSVDPVKIYEYIHFHKPIIAIDYGEMHKFSTFVNLYSNETEFLELILELQNENHIMYSESDALNFLNANTWDIRCEQIKTVLERGY